MFLEFTIRFKYIIIHNTNAFILKTSFAVLACGVLCLLHPVVPEAFVDVSEMSVASIFYAEDRSSSIPETLTY
jgi:hypothetical protein